MFSGRTKETYKFTTWLKLCLCPSTWSKIFVNANLGFSKCFLLVMVVKMPEHHNPTRSECSCSAAVKDSCFWSALAFSAWAIEKKLPRQFGTPTGCTKGLESIWIVYQSIHTAKPYTRQYIDWPNNTAIHIIKVSTMVTRQQQQQTQTLPHTQSQAPNNLHARAWHFQWRQH